MTLKSADFRVSYLLISISIIIFIITIVPTHISTCPRMQCAPIISKCQLLDYCRCEAKLNYSCYLGCSHCLGDLYSDCCSCVDICPKENETDKSIESHVKLFETTNDDLFEIFTNDEDLSGRWHITTEPISTSNSTTTLKCTMAFLSSCTGMYQCESSCMSMGASGFRWFHIGCCECVGKYCLNFGINQIRCRQCPLDKDQVIDSGVDAL